MTMPRVIMKTSSSGPDWFLHDQNVFVGPELHVQLPATGVARGVTLSGWSG
jgi:hypothetical protein